MLSQTWLPSEKIAAVAGDTAEMAIYPEDNHVCDNIPYTARPLVADWVAQKLRACRLNKRWGHRPFTLPPRPRLLRP